MLNFILSFALGFIIGFISFGLLMIRALERRGIDHGKLFK